MKSNENLKKAATFLLKYISDLAPEYEERIGILKTERGFDDLQAIGSMVCIVLDRAEHLSIPTHPAFQPNYEKLSGPIQCPCGKMFQPEYNGMNRCSNECAYRFRV